MTAGMQAQSHGSRLVRGESEYLADIIPRDALHLVVVRSPSAHAEIRSIGIEDALRAPGVELVLSADNFPHPQGVEGEDRTMPEVPIRVSATEGFLSRRLPLLATDRVRYVGQPVAIVVAKSRHLAEDAADRVRVDLEPLPIMPDIATGVRPGPGEMADSFCTMSVSSGEEAPVAAHEVAVRLEAHHGRNTAVPMETRGLVASFQEGRLHVWGATKTISNTRFRLADHFGLHLDDVIIHRVDVGGMFGPRGELYPEDFLVPLASQMLGRPVAFVEDRAEHFVATQHARDQFHDIRIRCDDEGRFLSLVDEALIDMGAYAGPIGSRLLSMTLESLPGPYLWGSLNARCTGIVTNKSPIGVMRGPGTIEATFARERAIDIAARRLQIDPLEVRLRNLIPSSALPLEIDLGDEVEESIVYDAGDYRAVTDQFLDDVDFGSIRAEVDRRRRAGEHVGIGWAMFVAHSGLAQEETVSLALDADGMFRVGMTATEFGQGIDAVAAKVASRALGVPTDRIHVWSGDSRAHSGGRGSFSSRSTLFVGSAIVDASKQLIELARARAAELREVPAERVELSDGQMLADGEVVMWDELAPLDVVGRHTMDHPTWGFGLHLAVVAVDPGTGAVTVERLAVGYDCGKIIDEANAYRQVAGACAQALSGALFEELEYSANGSPTATTFKDYRIASSMETPRVDVHLYETAPAPGNALGARGVGEAGMYGVPAAIANACANALDSDEAIFGKVPLTAEAVCDALHHPGAEVS